MASVKLSDVAFLISSTSIYENRQWDTAHCGPAYARSMQIGFQGLMQTADFDGVFIIDTVVDENECMYLETIIDRYPESFFVFKIIDPYFEYEKEKYFFRTLFKVARKRNVFFISNLFPAELTKELDAFTDCKKILFLPYPYQEEKELDVRFEDFLARKHKICYSGAVNALIYPNRSIFLKKWKRNPLLWNKIEYLVHPGYKDLGYKLNHNLIGNNYVDHLAQYKVMYCDSSRSNLEFAKFGECAYAHCIPIGEAPNSFSGEMKQYLWPIDYGNLGGCIKKLNMLKPEEQYLLGKHYRESFKSERNVALLRSKLSDFLNYAISTTD